MKPVGTFSCTKYVASGRPVKLNVPRPVEVV